MTRHAPRNRDRRLLEQLRALAAPGFEPWVVAEPRCGCGCGKRRWPTEHAAQAALAKARGTRQRRARGEPLGKIELRLYRCPSCEGFHLTSLTEDDYAASVARRRAPAGVSRAVAAVARASAHSTGSPSPRAISMRCTSEVPSPISSTLASR